MRDSALLLADLYAADKNTEQAIRVLTDSLQSHPGDADLFLRAGMIFEKIQRWIEARNAYEHVLQLDDDNAVAKNNLAWLLLDHGGNVDLALTLAQQAKQRLTDNLQVTGTVGWAYYKKGIYLTAWRYLKECAEKDQRNATFQYQLGMACRQLGKRDEARAALLNALKLNPNLEEAQSARETLAHL